jgi:hypothetical protein
MVLNQRKKEIPIAIMGVSALAAGFDFFVIAGFVNWRTSFSERI